MIKITALGKEIGLEKFIRWEMKRYREFIDPFLSKKDFMVGIFDFMAYYDKNKYTIKNEESRLFEHFLNGRITFGPTMLLQEKDDIVELIVQTPGRLSGNYVKTDLVSGSKTANTLVSNMVQKHRFDAKVFTNNIKSMIVRIDKEDYLEALKDRNIKNVRGEKVKNSNDNLVAFIIPKEHSFCNDNTVEKIFIYGR